MRVLTIIIALFVSVSSPVRAADDVSNVQSIIRLQEQAIGRDDAASAFSFAAPSIQSIFQDPETFMSMVRKGYAPIYRHKSFDFGVSRTVEGKVAQSVTIVDADGVSWEALYILEQQPDGSMKISGCTLSKLVGA